MAVAQAMLRRRSDPHRATRHTRFEQALLPRASTLCRGISRHPEQEPYACYKPASLTFEIIGGFESTYIPKHDIDVVELSRHHVRWREDLTLLKRSGVTRLRYPVRWHRIAPDPGSELNWDHTDEVLGFMRDEGLTPVVDLVHHTSYPKWLEGFQDPRFHDSYLAYCEAFARRYPWVDFYTLFNEPFATLFLCGQEAVWPPYGSSLEELVGLFRNVLPALTEASRLFRSLLPHSKHVYVDTCEGHSALDATGESYNEMANDRRFFVLDIVSGARELTRERPFVEAIVEAGGEDLLEIEPGHIDILGLDYYAHSEWAFYDDGSPKGLSPSPQPRGLGSLITEYHQLYPAFPLWLTETNIRGFASDRVTWMKYTLEQCEQARATGAPIEAYCWFPFIDSLDWDSLLSNADGHVDPVGVYWLDDELGRRESSMSQHFRRVASGCTSEDLPAFRLQPPVDAWLTGLMPQMAQWEWQDPPSSEVAGFISEPRTVNPEGVKSGSAS